MEDRVRPAASRCRLPGCSSSARWLWRPERNPQLGVYLVAFVLLGHAAWDAFHYVRDRVVARSYAEFCGFLDLLLGAAILVLA